MNRWYISKSHTTSKNTIDRQYTERQPANSRRISGRRFSPSEKFFGGREATTGNASVVCRLTERGQLQCWMLPRRGTRNGNRGKCMRNREEIGKQHREWVMKLLIGLRLAPVFHFLISVFVPCSLFLVLVMSILACGHGRISGRRFSPPGWRDRKYVCVRSSGQQRPGHLLSFRKVLLGI